MSEQQAYLTRQHRYSTVPEHLTLDPRISDRAFRLWCRLDRFVGDKEVAFPARETLAIELDTSPSSIDRATRDLVGSGWLVKTRRGKGDVCVYMLTLAPQEEVTSLIEAARAERRLSTEPRRERARELRTAKRQRAAQNKGAVTSDKTGGLVTDDKTRAVTSDKSSLVTGDKEKEATPEGGNREGSSDPSLRSGPAAAEVDDAELPGMPPAPAPAPKDAKAERLAAAGRIVTGFQAAVEAHEGFPIPKADKARGFHALRSQYVEPALEVGATEEQIKRALWACGSPLPPKPRFRDELVRARGRQTVGDGQQRRGRGSNRIDLSAEDQQRSNAEFAAAFG